ncbi:hypothetical protein PAPHI01_0447 [Pancytospora philotis]|nr:hypothetical protein PAPHI01_0447 [Pancytospora philotis]
MLSYEARLASFRSWPAELRETLAKKLALIGQHALAGDGDGEALTTVCVYCDKKMQDWRRDDDPLTEHMRHNNNCLLFHLERLRARQVLHRLHEADGPGTGVDLSGVKWTAARLPKQLALAEGSEAQLLAKKCFIRFDIKESVPFSFCYLCGASELVHSCWQRSRRLSTTSAQLTADTAARPLFYIEWLKGKHLDRIGRYLASDLCIPNAQRDTIRALLDAAPAARPFETIGDFVTRAASSLALAFENEIEQAEFSELQLLK